METLKEKLKITGTTILWMLFLAFGNLNAQDSYKESGMKIISDEIVVNSSPEETWEALAAFGNVSDLC